MPSTNHTLLITGGCRSGKSQYALTRFQNFSGKKFLLATAEALDEEMTGRIKRHRQERGDDWTTLEEPLKLDSIFQKEPSPGSLIVLDCLTLWVSNMMIGKYSDEEIFSRTDQLIRSIKQYPGTVAVVTNEVGSGIVPDNAMSRQFRDLAGHINQRFAEAFDEVVLLVSGLPLTVKQGMPPSEKLQSMETPHAFPETEKQGVYNAIYQRRDMRHFLPDPIHPKILGRILDAAHHAGSVGFMQPWNFIVIDDPAIKQKVYENFKQASTQGAEQFEGEQKELYLSMKLQGILDAPINICVTCDSTRMGPNVLGRNTMPETDLFSTSCAVQNLWLSARAEGLAVGWVSILEKEQLKTDLNIPQHLQPVAYLCIGHCDGFYREPMLQSKGWAKRLSLEELVFYNRWEGTAGEFKIVLPRPPEEPH